MQLIKDKNSITAILLNRPELVIKIYIREGYKIDNVLFNLIKNNSIVFETLERKDFFNITKSDSSNVVAEVKPFNYTEFNNIFSNKENSKILILDRIYDPQNFGAIIRSAYLFNIDAIIILDKNQCEVTASVISVSVGCAYFIDICKVNNISNAINILKQKGYWIYGSYLSDYSVDIKSIKFDNKSVIIIGSEGDGMSKKISANCDYLFKIDINNSVKGIDSLNASVAAGIIFYVLNN